MITRFLIVCALILITFSVGLTWMTEVDGASDNALFVQLDREGEKVEENLKLNLKELSFRIGERRMQKSGTLSRGASFIRNGIEALGLEPIIDDFTVRSKQVRNISVLIEGTSRTKEVVVFATHYDTVRRSPGANACGSAVVVLLELARLLRDENLDRSVRIAFLVNGEDPYRGTSESGASKYAKTLTAGEEIVEVVICLDSVGYFTSTAESQSFPFPLSLRYPDVGDFLLFSGPPSRAESVKKALEIWGRDSDFPTRGCTTPGWFMGANDGDHLAFIDAGFEAIGISDTGENRWEDTGGRYDNHVQLSFDAMALLTMDLVEYTKRLTKSGF